MASNKTDKTASTPAQSSPAATRPADPIEGLYQKWIIPFGWRIAVLILLALVAVALIRTMGARRTDRQGAGFAALSKAQEVGQPKDPTGTGSADLKKDDNVAARVEALLAVARDHDGSPAAARAQLEAAQLLYEGGKYDQAATKFSLARKAAQDSASAVAAGLGEAYAVEAMGKPEIAEKSFADLAGSAGSDALALDAWLGAGRCAKAQGKLAEAEKYCARAKEKAGDSPFSRRRVDEASSALNSARYAQRAAEPAKPAEVSPAATPAATPAKP